MVSDTVGFVRELPHSLVEAFKATLEETAQADLLVHVIDASSPERHDQIRQVESVLNEIDAGDVPVLKVYNKADLLDSQRLDSSLQTSADESTDASESPEKTDACDTLPPVFVSAVTGMGFANLSARIAALVKQHRADAGQRGYVNELVERDPRGIDLP